MSRQSRRAHFCALVGYAFAALAFTWPLASHLSTHLPGSLDGDTAVYVWNQWVFHEEVVTHRSLPYFTDKIFSLSGRANLSLHNYTTFANVLALPLIARLGVVTTFNVVYLLLTVLTAYAVFVLLLRLTAGAAIESWLGGLVFAWCPLMVTRGMGHYSLIAAAPLAVFLLLLPGAYTRWRFRDGAALGATVAWAATTDVYYAVFCVLIAIMYAAANLLRITKTSKLSTRTARFARALEVLIVIVAAVVIALVIGKGGQFTVLGRIVQVRTLYNPVLALTVLILVRVALRYHTTLVVNRLQVSRLVRLGAVTAVVATVMLSPVLYALGVRLRYDPTGSSKTFWRSSPPGVNAAALLLPNPNHWFSPDAIRDWLAAQPNGYLENVASVPLIVLVVLVIAWTRGWRAPAWWAGLTLSFVLLALGPFVHIAAVDTHVPGPWALLRYVPILSLARTPARFAVVAMLGIAVLFGLALQRLAATRPAHRRAILGLVSAVLFVELLPVPRQLYSAAVPRIYDRIAADPRPDIRVLELPVGYRDGTSSVGDFHGRAQFFQTHHGKPLIGGYLSRVSRRRIADVERRFEVVWALIQLSEGQNLSEQRRAALAEPARTFTARRNIGYVVVDERRASTALVRFAEDALKLRRIDADAGLALYVPRPAD